MFIANSFYTPLKNSPKVGDRNLLNAVKGCTALCNTWSQWDDEQSKNDFECPLL